MKVLISTMSFLFKKSSVVEVVYLFIRFKKTKFFLQSTHNNDRNGVNEQKTNQTLRERQRRTGGGVQL